MLQPLSRRPSDDISEPLLQAGIPDGDPDPFRAALGPRCEEV